MKSKCLFEPFHLAPFPPKLDVDTMINLVRESLGAFESRTDSDMIESIREHLDQFHFAEQLLMSPGGRTLRGQEQGTQFYIQPTDEALELDIEGTAAGDTASPLLKMLIGFTNTMTPQFDTPVISTAFRDHKTPDLVEDLIEEHHFFTTGGV